MSFAPAGDLDDGCVPASAQQVVPTTAPAHLGAQSAKSIPDFSGIWRHGNLPLVHTACVWARSGAGYAREKGTGVSDYGSLVGDYKNPILQPWAADVVKKKGELSLAGIPFRARRTHVGPNPCRTFKHAAMEMLQRPTRS